MTTTRASVPSPAVIAASAPEPAARATRTVPLGQPVRISLIDEPVRPIDPIQDAVADALSDALSVSESASAATPEDAARRMVVTGSRVNMRAGPSTANPVVTSLPRGAEVVIVGEAGGWMELRDPDSGLTGFMSANFLAPA